MNETINETLSASEFREKYGEEAQQNLEGLEPAHKTCDHGLAIDPGRQTGLAWTDGDRVVTGTSDWWEVWDALATLNPSVALDGSAARLTEAPSCCVILEAPYKSRQSMGAGSAVAYNSGQVAREAELMAEWLRGVEYRLIEHDPSQQGQKWDSSFAHDVAGAWEGPDNSDVRDAVRLLFIYHFL